MPTLPIATPGSPISSPNSLPELGDVPPAILRSEAAFEADLPTLLEQHPHRWVAYIDGRRSRVADTQTELYRYCLNDLGLSHDAFIVRGVVPDEGPDVESTPR